MFCTVVMTVRKHHFEMNLFLGGNDPEVYTVLWNPKLEW